MRRFKLAFIIALLLTIITIGTVYAATWEYKYPTVVTDNSSVARSYVPTILGWDGQTFIDAGKINSSGNNTNMQIGASTIKYMMSTDNVVAIIPSLAASGKQTVDFYTGYSPVTNNYTIAIGYNGYITVADDVDLEPSSNYSITQTNSYINTSATTTVKPIYSHYDNTNGGLLFNVNPYTASQLDLNVLTGGYYETFDGAADYANKAAGVVSPSGAAITLDAMFYITALGAAQTIVSDGNVAGGNGWRLDVAASGQMQVYIGIAAGGSFACQWTQTSALSAGQWYWVTVVYNNAASPRLTVYVNGSATAGTDIGAGGNIYQPNTNLGIGRYDSGASQYFGGRIDEVRISQAARTLANHLAFYYGGVGFEFTADGSTTSLYHMENDANPNDTIAANNLTGGGGAANPVPVAGGCYVRTSYHTYAAVTSAEHDIISGLSGGNLSISIDGVQTTTAFAGAVPNSTSNWTILNGVSTHYTDDYKHTVGGTDKLHFAVTSMLSGTTLPDLEATGGSENGTITWGTNENTVISYGTMISYDSYLATISDTGGFDTPAVSLPSTWFASGENLANLPFYDSFLSVSLSTGQPPEVLYFLAILGFAFGAFLLLAVFSKSALLGALGFNIVLFIGSSMSVVPMWIPVVTLIVMFGILYLYRQVAY